MAIRQQQNLVLEIEKNNLDDLAMLTQLIQEGWKVIHMDDLTEKEKESDKSILRNNDFKVILVRIFK